MSNDDAVCGSCRATPIPEPTSGIGRRTFLVQSAVLAAAAALAACGAGGEGGPTSPTLSGSATLKVSDYPALASVGGIALVTISSSPFAIVRSGDTTFVALSRICPHQGSVVNLSAGGFLCPNHGARFSSTGQWEGGQPTGNMHSYPTAYDAATGTLTVG